jgi:hypothetical protein
MSEPTKAAGKMVFREGDLIHAVHEALICLSVRVIRF